MARFKLAGAQAIFAAGAGVSLGTILFGIYSCGDLALMLVRLLRGH